jgi:dolichol-phosphate mannosyltransferase
LKTFDASVIIPAYNEVSGIQNALLLLSNLNDLELEVLVVVDSDTDSTIRAVKNAKSKPKSTVVLVQTYGGGPANAIRFGMDAAQSDCVIVTMADGSDDVRAIPDLINLVSRGVAVACASRYMSGGQQIGGPRFKKFLSKTAGRILFIFAGVGTHDPTNSFKAYSRAFISSVGIESRTGFEIGIELVAKARRCRLPIAEVPTIWLDRTIGSSRFKLAKFAPKYLRWFFHSFGPALEFPGNRKR